MVLVEGDDYRTLRRPGDDPAQFRSVVRLPRGDGFGVDNAVTQGLVLWYRMENTNSNTATVVDATNNLSVGGNQAALDGINNGGAFRPGAGSRDIVSGAVPSGAYSPDGADDFIELPGTGAFQGAQPYSVSFFLSLDSKPASGESFRIFGNGFNGNTHPFHIEYDNGFRTNSENILIRRFDGVTSGFITGGPLPLSTLKLITVTHDSNDNFEIFVDAVSQNQGGLAPQPVTNNARELIGAIDNDRRAVGFTDCTVDDLRVYNRVVTDSEINERFSNTAP
jgi:hypothetical protein